MNQTLDGWQVVEEEVKRSKILRVNWKEIFGMSLTKKIAELKASGFALEETLDILKSTPGLNGELKRRIKIGVCARYGEIKSEEKARIKIQGTCLHCGK